MELINLLRPTVEVAWFVMFAALALHQYPECRDKLDAGQDDYLERFVQEVRRFYPFFPINWRSCRAGIRLARPSFHKRDMGPARPVWHEP